MGRPATYDHLKSSKRPVTRSVLIALDSDVAQEYTQAKDSFESAKLSQKAKPADAAVLAERDKAEEAFKKAEAVMQESSVKFTFRSLNRKKYDSIVSAHPPTEDQKKQVVRQGGDPKDLPFDVDGFSTELISTCILEPQLSPEEIDELLNSDDWNSAEIGALFGAAFEANNTRNLVDLGNGSRGTDGSS